MSCADAHPLISLHLDGALSASEERRLLAHLARCPACRAEARRTEADERLIAAAWAPVAAPAGFAARVTAALPVQSPARTTATGWRRPLPALAAALAVVAALGLLVPPVRAGVGGALRSVFLQETSDPPRERLVSPGAALELEQARAAVPWQIRTPQSLPEGYRLVAVTVGEVHQAAVGPTVVLHYERGAPWPAASLRIVQLRAAGPIVEPVERGVTSSVRMGGRDARIIDGAWEERDGRRVWVRGSLLRLIVEDDGQVIQLEADPREGWDEASLIGVAGSLR